MRDDVTKVEIRKIDKLTDKLLSNAKLCIMDSDRKIITEWTTTDKSFILNGVLEAGKTYTLHEISAPKGYSLAKDIEFTVNKDGKKQVITMIDYPEKYIGLPDTGEGVWYLLILSLLIAGGLAGAYVYFYRKNGKQS